MSQDNFVPFHNEEPLPHSLSNINPVTTENNLNTFSNFREEQSPDNRKRGVTIAESPLHSPEHASNKFFQKINSKSSKDEETSQLAEIQIAKLLRKFYKSTTAEKLMSFVNWVESPKPFSTQKIYANIKDHKFFPTASSNLSFEQKTEINCIALSPDGKHFAIGLDYHGIILWDLKKLMELKELRLPDRVFRVSTLAMSSENLFSGGWDKAIHVWSLETYQYLQCFEYGHSAPILCLKVNTFEEILASGAEDNKIILWKINEPWQQNFLEAHQSPVSSLAWLANGTCEYLISASWDRTIKLWDLATFSVVFSLEGHTDMIRAIALSPNKKFLASGGNDRRLRIWNLEERKEIMVFEGHRDVITTINYSPDGGLVVSGSFDKMLIVWNVRKMEMKKMLQGHTDHVNGLVISNDGRKIVSVSSDQSFRVWNFDRDYEKHLLQGHKQEVLAIVVFPDNSKALSAGREKIVKVWDLVKVRLIFDLEGHEDFIGVLAVSQDNNRFASGDKSGRVIVWDSKNFSAFCNEKIEKSEILLLRFASFEGNVLISGCLEGNIKYWNMENKLIERAFSPFLSEILLLELSYDCNFLLTTLKKHQQKRLTVYNLQTHSNEARFESFPLESPINLIKSCYNANKTVTAQESGGLCIWDLSNKQLIRVIQGEAAKITCIDISKDNLKVITGHIDKTIRSWDMETGQQIGFSENYSDKILAIAITFDNAKMICTGGVSFALRVLVLNKLKTMRIFKHHKKEATSLALSPDQNVLAVGSSDFTISLWDLRNNCLLHLFEGHRQKVLAMKFSLDSKKLVSGAADHTINVWSMESRTSLFSIKKFAGWISDLVLSKDAARVLVSCHDKRIYYTSLIDKEFIHIYQHNYQAECVALSTDGELAYSGDKGGWILLHDLIGKKDIINLKAHNASINALALHEENSNVKLFTCSSDHTIKIWTLNNPHFNNQMLLIETLTAHTSPVYSIVINKTASKMFSASKNKAILMWDVTNFKQIAELDGHHSSVNSLCLTNDCQTLYSACDDHDVRVWNLNDSRRLPFLDGHSQTITRLAMTFDNKFVISGGADKSLIFWDLNNFKQYSCISGLDGKITGLAAMSNNYTVIVGTSGFITSFWDVEKSFKIDQFEFKVASCTELILTPDNKNIIIGYSDGLIRLWDLTRKEIESVFDGHYGAVNSLLITNFANKLISASDDQSIIIWDMLAKEKSMRKLKVLTGHEKEITSICSNWDNSLLFSAGHDKKVNV